MRRLPRSQAEQYIERHFHISWNEAFLGSLGGRPEAILGDGEAEAFSVERSAFEIESLTQFSAYPRYQLSITPGRYINNAFSLNECRRIMHAARVLIAGWALPFVGERAVVGPGYLFEKTDSGMLSRHVEEWRFYRNGQFLFESVPFELLEDGFEERARAYAEFNPHGGAARSVEATGFLSFVALIYFITTAYIFAQNLTAALLPDEHLITIRIGLKHVNGYAFGASEIAQRLSKLYCTFIDNPQHIATFHRDDLATDAILAAQVAAESIFEQFNWDPDRCRATIESYQRSFLRGRA